MASKADEPTYDRIRAGGRCTNKNRVGVIGAVADRAASVGTSQNEPLYDGRAQRAGYTSGRVP
jgi:hypothetical protein